MATLGAAPDEKGVSFGVYSGSARAMDLCIYDPDDPTTEALRVRMEKDELDIWQTFVPDLPPGVLYGYRAHGPWEPQHGHWYNPHKLLLDPYAKAIQGKPLWASYLQNRRADGCADFHDRADKVMKSVVIRDEFDWEGDTHPRIPWESSVIYEMHVRGFTARHPEIPADLRGTYAGLGRPEALNYLKALGVTALQLMPVHFHLHDGFLLSRKLVNYWGYNTAGFFAPHSEYAAAIDPQAQVDEFKHMVREIHRAGMEVILDVVYNHTCEGSEDGPVVCFRGLDNRGYYMLNGDAYTVNYTGCGNTVNPVSPPALKLILDSMRYWVEVMHVDGFRFDLAATMGRRGDQFDGAAPFFTTIAQDPVLSKVKLIAEPWDIGPNGYQVGAFPRPWRELNGRYRDKVRRFWRGDEGITAAFAKRLCGSQDIFGPAGRPPQASVNMLTSHDGFTLRDLWTYNHKRNEANGEENRDGDNHNNGWNCGVEGETKDRIVAGMRRRLIRACMATMFCSLGVPFITMGDEKFRTQKGNNNAYCQDNDISWFDWALSSENARMLDFTRHLIRFRNENPALRRRFHFDGKINPLTGKPDIEWFDEDGKPLSHDAWHQNDRRLFGALIHAVSEPGENRKVVYQPLLLVFNASAKPIAFTLPPVAGTWTLAFDTSREQPFPQRKVTFGSGSTILSTARTVACLMLAPRVITPDEGDRSEAFPIRSA